MKKRLSKKAIAGIALLGTAALTGSVFAGWLIVDANARGEGTGNVTVYDVVDKSLSVKNIAFKYGDTPADKGNVIFGKPKTKSSFDSSSVWFWFGDDGDNSMEEESFPTSFSFDVFSGKDLKEAPTVKVTFKVEEKKATEYKKCLDALLITGPSINDKGEATLTSETMPSATEEDGKNKYSYDISLGFGWGTHFDGKNPYNFYNEKKRDSPSYDSTTYEQDVAASLGTLFSLDGATYSITIEATPSTASAGE